MPSTLEEYRANPSSKLDVIIFLLRHHMERDDNGPVHFDEDGKITDHAKAPPLAEGQLVSQETKMLVYQHFTSFGLYFRTVRSPPLKRGPC